MKIFISCFVMLYSLMPVINGQGQCQNYYNQPGTCVPITSCQSLNSIDQNPNKSFWDQLVINGNLCGADSNPKKVCCIDAGNNANPTVNRAPFGMINIPITNSLVVIRTTTPSTDTTTNNARQNSGQNTVGNTDTFFPVPGSNKCGTHFPDKVHGGEVAAIDEHPWLAQLEATYTNGLKEFRCGGALINSRTVLTAAHCLPKGSDAFAITGVRLGEWNTATRNDCHRGTCSDPPQDISVEEITPHPEFVPGSDDLFHDIALLRLSEKANFSSYVKPICLPSTQELRDVNDFNGKTFDVAGWGATEVLGASDIKLRVALSGVGLDTCNWIWRQHQQNPITDRQICAGGDVGKDSCQGDSGGPLMLNHKDKEGNNFVYAAGIVSYGRGCGLRNWPGVYTNVASYMDWIQENVKA